MAFEYNELVIFALFRSERPEVTEPSKARLEKFDADLKTQFDQILIEKMQLAEIPINRENKSRVLLFAMLSNGGDSVRVRSACRYFNHVMGLNLSTP